VTDTAVVFKYTVLYYQKKKNLHTYQTKDFKLMDSRENQF